MQIFYSSRLKAYYVDLYHAIDICNAGMSCSSLEVVNKMKAISFVSCLRAFSAICQPWVLLNGARKNKFLDLAYGPRIRHYSGVVHVVEENYREDCSDNTAVSKANGPLSS
jgi:hypothetical protein